MSQRRYFNFGTPVSAGALNEAHSTFTTKGVLKGGSTYIIQPNILVIQPISLVFPTGIIFQETEATQLVIPFSSTNLAFTVTYRHNDGGLIGGTGATLQVEPGFIANEDPALADGLAVAYIKYPGTGPLLQTHIYEAPQTTIDATVTVGDGDYRLPPFGEGFLLLSQTPPAPLITPTVTSNDSTATYQYTSGAGGLLFTAIASGGGGNSLFFNLTPDTSESVVAVTNSKFAIHFNNAVSTMQSIATFLNTSLTAGAIAFRTKFAPVTTTGVALTLVTAFPLGNTGSDFVNLSGGVTNNGISYMITNTDTNDMTHVLKWVFVAKKQSPRSIVLEFSLGGNSSISLTVVDTNGNIVDLDSPTDVIQSSGLTRRTVRITDGNFISGYRYVVQASVLTKAGESSTITFIGASHYNLPF